MRIVLFLAVGFAIAAAPCAMAQGVGVGKYTGRVEFTTPAGRPRSEPMEVTIEKLEGDRFTGFIYSGFPNCRAEIPIEGRVDGDVLKVRGKSPKDGCPGIDWELKVSGGTLEGTSRQGQNLRFSK